MQSRSLKSTPGATLLAPWKSYKSPFYSPVTTSNGPCNIVTTAGQIGLDEHGNAPTDPIEQIKLAISNLKRCLDIAGAAVEDIMKLTYYIVDLDTSNMQHRGPLLEFLGDHRPASTLVPVPKLAVDGVIFEIEAVAAVPQRASERVDVIVVGAGLSGLQAAVDLQKAGLSVKVLEARDRVGGKTWSQPVRGGVCDVGAAWINVLDLTKQIDTNQSKMYALAERFGLDVVMQNTQGRMILDDSVYGKMKAHPYGELIHDEDDKISIEDAILVRDSFERTCLQIDITKPVESALLQRKDLDDITFADWVKSFGVRESALNALTIGVRAMLGVEPTEISALYYLDYCKSGGGYMQMRSDLKEGGQYLRIAQGTQSFSLGLAEELQPGTVVLQSPVRSIEQRDGVATISTARGVFTASRVVVSIPTPLYKDIAFDPPLPPEKQALAAHTRLGDYCKMIVIYERPWWRDFDLCGLTQSSEGPITVTRDSSVERLGHYSLTCFIVGEPARRWSDLSSQERRESVLAQLRKLFDPFAKVEEPIETVEQIWRNEQWSQGCPCPVMGPGGLTEFEHVLRSPAGGIHFVGTETAFEWKGYMEGAVRSGERGAQEVLLSLNSATG